ncbi:hypothetical protein DSO57_1034251 [Entomophthora muscae]|uniref:Uncharacterized protein n=1 Tax=Entomophthora muscae TaxID=34485 RepID=A0ACC2REN2_9FUNG|nr:hypothetical protein DSO57_1034251 [Entomophthora muscae]
MSSNQTPPTLSKPPAQTHSSTPAVMEAPPCTEMISPLLIAQYMVAQQLPHFAKGNFKLWLHKFKNHYCVEDEPDELEREKLEWNPFVKKKVTKDVRNKSSAIMDEIAVLKSFLVQHTLGCPLSPATTASSLAMLPLIAHAQCPARLARMKPKVVDSMLMELMAVEKCVSTLPICTEVKHPQLFSPVIEKAKHLLSSCTPADPKNIHVAEPSPTCAPSPNCWTKAGICREDTLSPEDVNESKKHLKLFEDAIQTLLDKLSTLLEELGDEQH